ncbi:hypothetical protein CK203_051358 [Vitis vinifera]|uniref:Non-structural maintenance of chromosomes element 1 homolog n=1 Tax=Vitis vinifera TaxID=29760 RepID=A0A438FLW3_VITVI|nr:hypothetical protein CK203_051358 [Vitis vinifera]
MPDLSWRHHALIQALLSRGPSSRMTSTPSFPASPAKIQINKELSYVHLELRGCRNQYDGKVYYGVVNNVSDEQSKLGTKYTVPQLAFYKGIKGKKLSD